MRWRSSSAPCLAIEIQFLTDDVTSYRDAVADQIQRETTATRRDVKRVLQVVVGGKRLVRSRRTWLRISPSRCTFSWVPIDRNPADSRSATNEGLHQLMIVFIMLSYSSWRSNSCMQELPGHGYKKQGPNICPGPPLPEWVERSSILLTYIQCIWAIYRTR